MKNHPFHLHMPDYDPTKLTSNHDEERQRLLQWFANNVAVYRATLERVTYTPQLTQRQRADLILVLILTAYVDLMNETMRRGWANPIPAPILIQPMHMDLSNPTCSPAGWAEKTITIPIENFTDHTKHCCFSCARVIGSLSPMCQYCDDLPAAMLEAVAIEEPIVQHPKWDELKKQYEQFPGEYRRGTDRMQFEFGKRFGYQACSHVVNNVLIDSNEWMTAAMNALAFVLTEQGISFRMVHDEFQCPDADHQETVVSHIAQLFASHASN